MTKIFISYSRKDKAFAEKLHEALNRIKLDSWIDWIDIPPTSNWWEQIQKGIEAADSFLFLLSPDSITSQVCRQEIEHAIMNGKRLIPLLVREVSAAEVHPNLKKLNWIFFREQDDFEKSLQKLEAGIKTDLAWVEFHTRLQVRAVEWAKGNDSGRLLRGKDLREAEEQLAASGNKDPQPTDLQRRFALESHKWVSRTRNTLLVVGGVVMMALVFLSIFAFNQSDLAENNANTAIANQIAANTSEAVAVNAANAQATAQMNEEIQRKLAEEQLNIAIARRLSIQAETVAQKGSDRETQTVSLLLAVESMKRYPSVNASNSIRGYSYAREVSSSIHGGPVNALAFSPDGNYVVAGDCAQLEGCHDYSGPGTARVSEASTGREVSSVTHDGVVISVAFSPDGKYVVSGGGDGTARVWEAATGTEISRRTHEGVVMSVTFSPDGKYAASGGFDGNIYVWNFITGAQIFRAQYSPFTPVNVIAFSPDGKYLASGGREEANKVWDIRAQKVITQMTHEYDVISLAFSPDSKLVMSGGLDNTARIWELSTGSMTEQLRHAGNSSDGLGEIKSVAFSPDGKYVVTGGSDNTARVWWTDGGSQEVSRMTHTSTVNSVAFTPDGNYVLSAGWDNTVRIWETLTGREITRMTYPGETSIAALSPDGRYVVSSGCDQLESFVSCSVGDTVRVWEISSGAELYHFVQEGGVALLGMNPNAGQLLSWGYENVARSWDLDTKLEVARISPNAEYPFLAYSPDGKYAAATGRNRSLEIWDTSNGTVVTRFESDAYERTGFSPDGKYLVSIGDRDSPQLYIWETRDWKQTVRADMKPFRSIATDIVFSPEGRYLAMGGCDESVDVNCNRYGSVGVWELATGNLVSRVTHAESVRSISFSPDGRYVVSGGCEEKDINKNNACVQGAALISNTLTGERIFQKNFASDVTSVAFSPDGKYMGAGGCEQQDRQNESTFFCTTGTSRVWEISTGFEVAHTTQGGEISLLVFSPDGNYIASGSDDGTIPILDVSNGSEIARNTHSDRVTAILFSPDGKYIVSGSRDGTIRAWLWRPADMIDYACSRATRNLTLDEWNEYVGTTPTFTKVCPELP